MMPHPAAAPPENRKTLPVVNILTLKWGDLYGPHYVNILHSAISRHLTVPFRFLCFTDNPDGILPPVETHPLPPMPLPKKAQESAWIKLGLFQDGLADLSGPCLFLDLDLIITGPLDPFFTYKPGVPCIIHNWLQAHQKPFRRAPDVGNSSIFRFEAGTTGHIVDTFLGEAEWALENFHPEQVYLTRMLGREKSWWPDSWVRSFKRHCIPPFPLNLMLPPRMPPGARIVVFHGRPNPDEAIRGMPDARLHRRSRPAPWVADAWR